MYLQGFGHVLHSNQTQNGNARRDRHAHDDGELACQDISLAVPFGSPVVHARLFALERPMRTPALVLFLVARLANLGDGCLMLVLAFCVRLLVDALWVGREVVSQLASLANLGVDREPFFRGLLGLGLLVLALLPHLSHAGDEIAVDGDVVAHYSRKQASSPTSPYGMETNYDDGTSRVDRRSGARARPSAPAPQRAREVLPARAPLAQTTDRKLPGSPRKCHGQVMWVSRAPASDRPTIGG